MYLTLYTYYYSFRPDALVFACELPTALRSNDIYMLIVIISHSTFSHVYANEPTSRQRLTHILMCDVSIKMKQKKKPFRPKFKVSISRTISRTMRHKTVVKFHTHFFSPQSSRTTANTSSSCAVVVITTARGVWRGGGFELNLPRQHQHDKHFRRLRRRRRHRRLLSLHQLRRRQPLVGPQSRAENAAAASHCCRHQCVMMLLCSRRAYVGRCRLSSS